jgi:HipA-like protein
MNMLRVWVDGKSVGALDRFKTRGSTFAYDPAAAPGLAVSVTMPSRTASWDTIDGLAPIFEMNLPEGVLLERLMRQFAKTLGSFDSFDLLGLVGKTQIGRLRYSEFAEPLSEDVPFQSIDEILKSKGTSELFDYLIEKFAIHSGLSGVQPKVMIRADEESGLRLSSSFKSATHIVKFWDPAEYPELAANEFFCLEIAKRLKFAVPEFSLSESGHALVIKRFDLGTDGRYLGFEAFLCAQWPSCIAQIRRRIRNQTFWAHKAIHSRDGSGRSPHRPVQIIRPELRHPQRRCSSQKLWNRIFGCRRRRTPRTGLRFNHDHSLHTGRRDGAHSGRFQEVAGSPGADQAWSDPRRPRSDPYLQDFRADGRCDFRRFL